MPQPQYMICAEEVITDIATNLVSHIKVVNQVAVTEYDFSGVQGVKIPNFPVFKIAVIAEWRRDENEEPGEYEYVMSSEASDGKKQDLMTGQFVFLKRFHRLQAMVTFTGKSRLTQGMLKFECRIRRSGTDEWLVQSYPVFVEVTQRISLSDNRDTDNPAKRS